MSSFRAMVGEKKRWILVTSKGADPDQVDVLGSSDPPKSRLQALGLIAPRLVVLVTIAHLSTT